MITSLFNKLTSQKPEIRKQPTEILNSTVQNKPAWVQLKGDRLSKILLRELQCRDEHKMKLKSVMRSAPQGVKSVVYKSGHSSSAKYTFARWIPLTAKNRLPSSYNNPFMRSSPHKKIGLDDAYLDTSRYKSFKLSEQIFYSYSRDIRFVLFLSIFFGYSLWMIIAPALLLNYPLALSSPDLKLLVNVIEDTYVYHVCSTHQDVISPCECGEPLNQSVRELFQ